MNTKKFIKRLALGIAVAGLCTLGAAAQTNPNPNQGGQSTGMSEPGQPGMGMGKPSDSMSSGSAMADSNFVKKAAQGGMAEVELGQLALQKASNPEVKKFAQRMVDDHTKANDQLTEVASSKNITLPSSLDAKDEATKEKLSGLSGAEFDKAYMSDMVKDHIKDVSEFKRESMSAKDPVVKNFASETLPTLEDHLKEAKSIAPQIMKGQMQ